MKTARGAVFILMRIFAAVEIVQKISLRSASKDRFLPSSNLGNPYVSGGPPPPHPLKSRDWRGVCKNGRQNIERLGVKGQNLDFKELASVLLSRSFTAFALAIICFLKFWRKGRCHMGLWISLSSSTMPRAESLPRVCAGELFLTAIAVVYSGFLGALFFPSSSEDNHHAPSERPRREVHCSLEIGLINQTDRWLPVRFRTFQGRRRTPSNPLVRPPRTLLSFVIRALCLARDWPKSCYGPM